VAEWHLDSARVVASLGDLAKEVTDAPAAIELPAELEQWKREGSSEVESVQKRLRSEFGRWLSRGYAAVGVRMAASGAAAYLLQPWSDF
jgi:predicted GNAT superfamily acetyltransferase